MDTNNDGVITRAEWRGSDRAFQNQDWNGDGRLSGQEVRIGGRRNQNFEEADHVPNRYERYVSWTQAGFNNLDHNRDRSITSNEWHFDVETFRRVDRNRDGALDQTEFLGGEVDDVRDASFDDLDWNNNGRVERSEWTGSPAVFTSLDRNRDGVLSRFEVVGGVDTPNDTYDEFASLDYNRNGSDQPRRMALVGRLVQPARREPRRHALASGVRGFRRRATRRSGRHIGWSAADRAHQSSAALDRHRNRRARRRHGDA